MAKIIEIKKSGLYKRVLSKLPSAKWLLCPVVSSSLAFYAGVVAAEKKSFSGIKTFFEKFKF